MTWLLCILARQFCSAHFLKSHLCHQWPKTQSMMELNQGFMSSFLFSLVLTQLTFQKLHQIFLLRGELLWISILVRSIQETAQKMWLPLSLSHPQFLLCLPHRQWTLLHQMQMEESSTLLWTQAPMIPLLPLQMVLLATLNHLLLARSLIWRTENSAVTCHHKVTQITVMAMIGLPHYEQCTGDRHIELLMCWHAYHHVTYYTGCVLSLYNCVSLSLSLVMDCVFEIIPLHPIKCMYAYYVYYFLF